MSEQIGRVLGARYRLLEPIGSGSAGRVFLAEDVQLRRRVAVKLLHEALAHDPTFRRRFELEAQAAAALSHPNILAVFDWGDAEGVPYLVTEYLAGGSLRDLLARVGRLSPSQTLVIGLESGRALDHAHNRGFVHRDVKPANLMFGEEGRLRIADFGLARALAETSITEPDGSLMGTARYMAPEQASGSAVDGKADVYSLALVLTEAATGSTPLTADSLAGTLGLRSEQDLKAGSGTGPLAAPLDRAGRRDPEQRSDAGELVLGLMATSENLTRPEPLPLAIRKHEPIADDLERTRIAPVASTADRALASSVPASHAPAAEPMIEVTDEVPIAREPEVAAAPVVAPNRSRPSAAAVALTSLSVLIACAAGGLAWWTTRIEPVAVPEVVGLDVNLASAQLAELGLAVDASRRDRVNGSSAGAVLVQVPQAGTELDPGEVVELTISLGEELTSLPLGLAGSSLEDAEAVLLEAGLAADTGEPRHSETVPEGHVIDVELPDGADIEALERGTRVRLILSSGRAPVEIPPGLEGQPVDAVQEELADAGIEADAEVEEVFDDDVPEGAVIETAPGAGLTALVDEAVRIIVSLGPEEVEVPSVIGDTVAEATATLEEAGFRVEGVNGSPNDQVVGQIPVPGTLHSKREGVELITG